jgi:hypothetical protein
MRYITPQITSTLSAISTIRSFKTGIPQDNSVPNEFSAGSAYQADE